MNLKVADVRNGSFDREFQPLFISLAETEEIG